MKRRRFFAPDMRRALNLVKASLGPQAIIFSHRKVEDGIEVEAGVALEDKKADPARSLMSVHHTVSNVSVSLPSYTQSLEVTPANVHVNLIQGTKSRTFELPRHDKSGMALKDMQHEITLLRGLMEEQLSEMITGQRSTSAPNMVLLHKKLHELGFTNAATDMICATLEKTDTFDASWQACQHHLSTLLPVKALPLTQCIAVMGSAGSGKTSSIVKLALQFLKEHPVNQLGLINLDKHSLASQSKLAQVAQLIKAPLLHLNDVNELETAIKQFKNKRCILIDTPAQAYLKKPLKLPEHVTKLMVLSATHQVDMLSHQLNQFTPNTFQGAVLTKLDEAIALGPVLSILMTHALPATWVNPSIHMNDTLIQPDGGYLVRQTIAVHQHALAKQKTPAPVIDFPEGNKHVANHP